MATEKVITMKDIHNVNRSKEPTDESNMLKRLLHEMKKYQCDFYTPVFRRDVLWYGDIRPSGSPSVSHSFPHFSPRCFDIMSWNFVYHFLLMNIRSSLSVVNFRQFLLELFPFWKLEYWKFTVSAFSLTCFDILSCNFAYDFFFYCTTDQVWVPSTSVNFCGSCAPFAT